MTDGVCNSVTLGSALRRRITLCWTGWWRVPVRRQQRVYAGNFAVT
jgi:hypothetical protein